MKANYKNWVPKALIVGMAAATVLSLTALIAFGFCGFWVSPKPTSTKNGWLVQLAWQESLLYLRESERCCNKEKYIMDLSVIFIEIAVMLIGFTVLVLWMLLISPLTFISDYPPEIQAEYYRSQHQEAVKEKLTKPMILKKLMAVVVFLFLFAGMLHLAGAKTFWQGVGLTWVYMLSVFAWDTFFLDWVLFANIKRVWLPGTEHMEREYHQKWFHVKVCLPVVPFAILAGFISSGLMLWIW